MILCDCIKLNNLSFFCLTSYHECYWGCWLSTLSCFISCFLMDYNIFRLDKGLIPFGALTYPNGFRAFLSKKFWCGCIPRVILESVFAKETFG